MPGARTRAASPPVSTLTTTEAAVLALLALEGERSGYDLTRRVARAIGHVWAPARSQLYAVLPRLAGAGLVSARAVREGGRPEKQLYALAPPGREALAAWLAAEPESIDTCLLRLFVGGLAGHDVLVRHLAWLRRTVEAQLDGYRSIESTNTRAGNDFYHHLLLRLAIERCEHLLAWADWAEEQLAAGRR
jgi:DNA-binding PadR family transcriptional regulator